MGNMARLRELLYKTQEYLSKRRKTLKRPAYDMKLEAMIPVIKSRYRLKRTLIGRTIYLPPYVWLKSLTLI